MIRADVTLAMFAVATGFGIAGAAAQTLTDPKTAPPPHPSAKSQAAERTDACRSFGAGFVRIPGTGACVKIGGGATTQATGGGN